MSRRAPGSLLPPEALAKASIRWKILVPFAALSLVFGALGAFVLSSGIAAEARAQLSARLHDSSGIAVEKIQDRTASLVAVARRAAFTEGLAGAVSRRDVSRVRRITLPLAANSGHSLVAVIDARGASLIEIVTDDTAKPVVVPGAEWAGERLIAAASTSATGEPAGGFLVRGGTSYLAVTTPILSGRKVVGVVVVGEALAPMFDALDRLTKTSLSLVGSEGSVLAGGSARAPRAKMAVLSVPISVRGRRAATLEIALPLVSRLAVLGNDGLKIALVTIALLGAVFVVGVRVAGMISRPLQRLVESTRALRAGDLAHRAPVGSDDEVGELAQSFNQMAEELEASHRDLERRVEDRTHELADALDRLDKTNAELQHASDAKSLFLANVSHELRTPLSGILIAAEMLHDPTFGMLPEDRVRDLGGKILGSGRHLLALIDDLLDLSRIESGRLELRPQPVSISSLLAEVRTTIEPVAAEKGVAVGLPSGSGAHVVVDPVRGLQVLFNLLSNAVKFTPPGGRVWVEVGGSNGEVSIAVRDTGIGIDRKHHRRIFEPFEQVSGTRADGAGLGLAISKRIVELHDGRLCVSSVPGKGSTFTVTLPAAKGPEVVPDDLPLEEAPSRAARGARVLVVEDDPVTLELVCGALKGGGHRVEGATTVKRGIARARAGRPDLVLLDLRLGEGDGLDVVRTLRAHPATANMPVTALSAHGMPRDIDRALAAGCDDYLVKPVSAKRLLAKVGEVLEGRPRSARREQRR